MSLPEFCCLCDGSLLIPTFGIHKFPTSLTECLFCYDTDYVAVIENVHTGEACHYQHLRCLQWYDQHFLELFGRRDVTCPGEGCTHVYYGAGHATWIHINEYRKQFSSQVTQQL